MNTWWIAIDKTWSSYAELSRRGAVAQGWPALGDLRTLIRFHPGAKDAFTQAVIALGDHTYGGETLWDEKDRQPQRAPAVFWNLIGMMRGDLVVALEGATVRGICQLPSDARFLYKYDPRFHYAQSLGPVDWHAWDEQRLGPPPTAPAQSVHGVKRLVGESDAVAEAWDRAGFDCKPIPACWVNVDLPTGLCTIHRETCRHALNARRTPYKGHGDLLRDGGWLEFNSRDAAESYADWLIDARSRLNVLHCTECR